MVLSVVAGIINRGPLFLVALRPPHVPFSGYWEFPGGKIELGESSFDALKRELYEEIGIHVTDAHPFLKFQHTYPNRTIDLDVWQITHFSGEPQGIEGQQLAWVTLSELGQLEFPDANRRVVKHLNLLTSYST